MMNFSKKSSLVFMVGIALLMTSSVSKKQMAALQSEYDVTNEQLGKCGESLNDYMARLTACNQDKAKLESALNASKSTITLREEQIKDLKEQVADSRNLRDKQISQVDELTNLSKSTSDNIKETLSQLERKDKYINLLQSAKNRADSINLALAINLKNVLKDGIDDQDVEIKVDKTVVFVNISDKMLFTSGSSDITPRANEVLGKIAQIVASRPEFEVMVEGYTDSQPISNSCMKDNWDLSVRRATSVVRILQTNYGIDPNRLIAAGRGEYNALASNDTAEGRSTNRRTRIIILPKLNQFYDLLNPNLAKK
ncbi:MAG: OmpA family protein [Saprospiraceae bacterium]